MAVALGEPITYVYAGRAVHAEVGRRDSIVGSDERTYYWFMPQPAPNRSAIPVSQFEEYEGITWERGWTDGIALLAAYILLYSC